MQDKERETLQANADQLADLLTENVPYLIGHYLRNDVITESEREDIIQASSAQEIKTRLVRTLAAKEDVSLEAIIEGLNATENQCVSNEINNLLSGNKPEEVADNGSGDKTEDLSTYATNLVDEVIAKAEKTTSEQSASEDDDQGTEENGVSEPISAIQGDGSDEAAQEEIATEKLVEANVEAHTTETVAPSADATSNDDNDVGDNVHDHQSEDAPDKNVNFSETVATYIEDGKHNDQFEEDGFSSPTSPTSPSSEEFHSTSLDAQNEDESDNEDADDSIDIDKEFAMPPEQVESSISSTNINNSNDNTGTTTVTNGEPRNPPKLVRMASNDIVLDNGKGTEEEGNNNNSSMGNNEDDAELAAALARKALVRQQVEMFEKNSPGGGKIKYSIRTATQDSEPPTKPEGNGSNVKNLKNFFQRLSSTDTTTAPPAGGPFKSVGKLKVTFPASS